MTAPVAAVKTADPRLREVETAIVAFLKADSLIMDITGGRIFPQKSPRAGRTNFPQILYYRNSDAGIATNTGTADLRRAVIQLDCWGFGEAEYQSAKGLAKAVATSRGGNPDNERLDGFHGDLPGFEIQGIWIEEKSDDHEGAVDASDEAFRRASLVLECWYKER